MDTRFLKRGTDAEVGSGSLNSILSGDTAKAVARSLIGLTDLGATISHRRCMSGSLAINEVDIRSLVREFRALGSEAGCCVLGTESGSLHAEGASSCLVLKTSLVEAELAAGAVGLPGRLPPASIQCSAMQGQRYKDSDGWR